MRPVRTTVITWLGIAAMVVQAGSFPVYYLLFSLNQATIARTVCERKVANCDGKCYLKKQIDGSQDGRTDRRAEQVESYSTVQFLPSSSERFTLPVADREQSAPRALGAVSAGWRSSLLQPPRLSA